MLKPIPRSLGMSQNKCVESAFTIYTYLGMGKIGVPIIMNNPTSVAILSLEAS